MIKIENLTKKYSKQTVLDILSLEIPSGQTFGLIGNNGAGKTTLFSCLLDLINQQKGKSLIMTLRFLQVRTGNLLQQPF